MKLLTGMVSHETNTFSNIAATLKRFQERGLYYGEEILAVYAHTRTSLGGFIEVAKREGIELIGTVAAAAAPSGRVTRQAFDHFLTTILEGYENHPDVDGILLALHGAMAVEGIDDGEGELLRQLRLKTGPDKPIVGTLDLHTNLGEEMIKNSNALIGYKTYPHIDTYERAVEAAELILAIIRGQVKPVVAFRNLPLLSPVVVQLTARDPVKSIMEKALAIEKEPDVLTVSVLPGFCYADIQEAGFGLIVVAHASKELAETKVQELADLTWSLREQFVCHLVPAQEAVAEALQAPEGPVILADVADNPGGGGTGDGTAILKELLAVGAKGVVVSTIWDPEATRMAIDRGVGEEISLRIGGKTDRFHGDPLDVKGRIRLISDGEYIHKGPMSHGARGRLGRAVVLEVEGIKIILHENRTQTLDPEVMRSLGIEPRDQKILVIKSSIHYRAAFEPLAKRIIEVDAPGLVSPHLERFPFQHIRRPIFPFDPME